MVGGKFLRYYENLIFTIWHIHSPVWKTIFFAIASNVLPTGHYALCLTILHCIDFFMPS